MSFIVSPAPTTPNDYVTHGVSMAAASSPMWLPWLQGVSEIAAMVAPILGVIWLAVQIISKFRESPKK